MVHLRRLHVDDRPEALHGAGLPGYRGLLARAVDTDLVADARQAVLALDREPARVAGALVADQHAVARVVGEDGVGVAAARHVGALQQLDAVLGRVGVVRRAPARHGGVDVVGAQVGRGPGHPLRNRGLLRETLLRETGTIGRIDVAAEGLQLRASAVGGPGIRHQRGRGRGVRREDGTRVVGGHLLLGRVPARADERQRKDDEESSMHVRTPGRARPGPSRPPRACPAPRPRPSCTSSRRRRAPRFARAESLRRATPGARASCPP
jgi:hypothetical protein